MNLDCINTLMAFIYLLNWMENLSLSDDNFYLSFETCITVGKIGVDGLGVGRKWELLLNNFGV